jgi:ribosomal protein L16/L10AE
MGLLIIDKTKLVEEKVKTTPKNVKEATEALFRATMNLPAAAKHCGMTQKEMKLTFWEFLKYNEPDYVQEA